MFENFKKIQIEGGYFEPSSELDLFDSNQCLSIIYGRNGSGKTSIAKAIRQLVGKDSKPQEGEVAVPYIVTSDAVIPEEKKPSVFIFDEEFVQENVRTKGNGLETIVMMGEQVDLDTQITTKKAEGTVVDSKVVEQTALKEKYENANDTEAFSSFCYNTSLEEMMCRKGVLNAISEEKRKYYENFMCRLALNGESHMEERVYALNTITPYFTKQEKVQTAKSLLLFLYYINKEHLSCYLGKNKEGDEDRMAEIEKWKLEEVNWINT